MYQRQYRKAKRNLRRNMTKSISRGTIKKKSPYNRYLIENLSETQNIQRFYGSIEVADALKKFEFVGK